MATVNEVLETAKSLKDLSNAAKSLRNLATQVLAFNSANAIDWNALPVGAETDGNITGQSFSAAEASNVIGSLDAYLTFGVTHNGNFEKLADPIV